MDDLIKALVEAWGPSGYEHHVRALIREEVEPLADDITVDPLGNLICKIGSGGKRVVVAAHMDEIGVMATYREPTSGYLRFEALGGVIPTTLLGSRVEFEDGTIGTIGIHDQFGAGRTKAPSLKEFYIDISDGTPDEFMVGQPAKFHGLVYQRGQRVFGSSMDDRIGCVVAIEAMRRLHATPPPNEVYFAFTVQEEVGLRGARTLAHTIQPDVGIAVDVTGTGDQPHGIKMAVKLGGGAAIKVKDSGLVVPPHIRDWMVNTAEANDIPYQLELLPFGTTDAAAIHTALAGIPSGTVSIPCRYVHTISETVDLNDVNACTDLLVGLLREEISL